MDIYNIPIAEITRQYLEHLAEMRKLDLEVAGEFLVIAATLIYIKSKMLLPQENEVEEDESGDDPRQELVRKLLEYQAFREAAKELGFLESERGKTFSRQIADYYLAELDPEDAGIDTFSANLFDLLTAFQNVLVRSGKNLTHEVFEEVISIEEKIAEVSNLLNRKQKVLFSELFKTRWTRNELIATFLALLEIVRTKIAFVKQDNQFGEIIIEKREEAA
ncbi:MAG: segregation/condensation protein A [Candidatus Omnitrophica bacterium]|nr:segregation/condensation protein A [Candidatus Omnitrophota bacterium]